MRRSASARCRVRATAPTTHPEPAGRRRSTRNARGPPFEDHGRDLRRELVARRCAATGITAVRLVDVGHRSPSLNACTALSPGRFRCHVTLTSMCRATGPIGPTRRKKGRASAGSRESLAHPGTCPRRPVCRVHPLGAVACRVGSVRAAAAAWRAGSGCLLDDRSGDPTRTSAGSRVGRSRFRTHSSLRKAGRSRCQGCRATQAGEARCSSWMTTSSISR
jgi:hypothetical protein